MVIKLYVLYTYGKEAEMATECLTLEEAHQGLKDFLLGLNETIQSEFGGKISISPIASPSEEYRIGLRHIVVLPWPGVPAEKMPTITHFIMTEADTFAKSKGLERFGIGPTFIAGGAAAVFIGLRNKR